MRAFGIALIAATAFAAVAVIGLNFVQKTSAGAYKSDEARFNQEEIVNNYGRQG
jgi:hypothetical protein